MELYEASDFYHALIKIMDFYGLEHQLYKKLPEELNELIEAIQDQENLPSEEHWKHVIEEAADVFILMEQFQMLLSKEDQKLFDHICMFKTDRQLNRIKRIKRKNHEGN